MGSYYYYGRLNVGVLESGKGIYKMMLEELVVNLVNKYAREQEKKLEKALLQFSQSAEKLIKNLESEIQSIKTPKKTRVKNG